MTENASNAILPDNCPLPWSRRNVNAAFQVADANGNHFLTAQMWNRGAAVPDDLLDYIVTAANNYTTVLKALRTLEDYASKTLTEIDDQDTGWFYQLRARVQKASAIIRKIDSVTP